MDLNEIVGNTDIYLIDQILKKRYLQNEKILDAGCGMGRNLYWFYKNDFDVYGVDVDSLKIEFSKNAFPKQSPHFKVSAIESLPFESFYFDHVICSAVLHFAENAEHFEKMIAEMIRVLKPKGSIFIRMTSTIGDKRAFKHIKDGIYLLDDDTERFLLTPPLLNKIMVDHKLTLLEPLKTTNVDNLRYMTTLVLEK